MEIITGVHAPETPEQLRHLYRAAGTGREFIGPDVPKEQVLGEIQALAEPWLDVRGGAYISYKPDPGEVAAGRWTEVHHRIGAWAAQHPSIRIIVHHEPETPKRGGLRGDVFAAMFRRARTEIRQGGPGVHVAYAALAYQWRAGGTAARDPGHWQAVEADEYLCDVYSGTDGVNGSFAPTTTLPQHPGFTGWFAAIVAPKLAKGAAVAWGFAERGFMAPGDDATRAATIRHESAWLTRLAASYATHGTLTGYPPSVYLAWSSPGAEEDDNWVLTGDSATAMDELLTAFARTGH